MTGDDFFDRRVMWGPEFATYFASMLRLPPIAVVIPAAVAVACGSGDLAPAQAPALPRDAVSTGKSHQTAFPAAVPETESDRDIRRALSEAVAQDPTLKERQISFLVRNGDVSVSGIVRSEGERTKINALALNIGGVKSVANALRVSE